MNGANLFKGSIFLIQGHFGSYRNFVSEFEAHFTDLSFDKKEVVEKLKELIEDYANTLVPMGQKEAKMILLSEDLQRIIDSLEKTTIPDPRKQLEAAYEKYANILQEVGMGEELPSLYIVERFPKPYEKMEWDACAPDEADKQKYDISPGIYFLESSLSPYYSAYLLAHELIHAVLGKKDPWLLARGLEEGICDLFGSAYMGPIALDSGICRNIAFYNRLDSANNQFLEMYLDYLRQALLIYNRFGLDGIVHLIKRGRKEIKRVERLCLSLKINEIRLPSGNWSNDLSDLLDSILLGFCRNLIVSPLAKYIAPRVQANHTAQELARKYQIGEGECLKAMEELQNRIFVILLDEGKVDFEDLKDVIPNFSLRYEIEENI